MTFLIFATTALLSSAQSGVSAPPARLVAWGEFARFPARSSPITITVGTVSDGVAGRPVYWAKRVGSTEGGTTDSVKCPALATVIEDMRRLPVPKIAPGQPELIIGDGTMYSLKVPSAYHPPHSTNLDNLQITSWGGPLGKWIDGSLLKLETCWSAK